MSTFGITAIFSAAISLASPSTAPVYDGEVLVQYEQTPSWYSTAVPSPSAAMMTVLPYDANRQRFADVAAALAHDPRVRRVEPNLLLWTQRDWVHRDVRSAQEPIRQLFARAQSWALRRPIRIGILDTGIDALHPDLDGAVLAGVNLVRHPQALEADDASAMDYNGHGTQVAGIIGARHNDFGIDGVVDPVELVPIKVFDSAGVGTLADVLAGIAWAQAHDIDILNMSFGTYEHSPMLAEALHEAAQTGMLLVAAAGNDGAGVPTYPAAYPDVLAIGSADAAGISRFSNFGPGVAFYAPGDGVLSTTSHVLGPNGYAPLSGTSAAAAYATGVVAIVLESGVAPSDAVAFMTHYSPLRHGQRTLPEVPYRPLGIAAVIAAAWGQPLSELTVPYWRAQIDDTALRVDVTLQNSGNTPLPAQSLALRLRGDGGEVRQDVTWVPTLQPQERFAGTYELPLPRAEDWGVSLLAQLEDESGRRLGAPEDLQLGREPASWHIDAIWITPHNRMAATLPEVHVRLHNRGSVAQGPGVLHVSGIAAVHEGIWSVPAQPLTPPIAVPALPPGAVIERVARAIAPLPTTDSFTLLAEVAAPNGTVESRAMTSLAIAPGGQAKLLYNQAAHMASVDAAVDVLKLQNIIIPDIHEDDAPFRGTPSTARDFGSAVAVGLSRWKWQWDTDWPAYPWSSKHLIDGANAADGIDVAYGDVGVDTWDTHFWLVDEGDNAGLGKHSAYNKIVALLLGGEGSRIKEGAIAAYRGGEQAKAWWMVGHAAHLLGDLSTGAHTVNRNWHGVVGDPYHDWMGHDGHFYAWPAGVIAAAGGILDPYRADLHDHRARLRFLAYTTAQLGSSFPWHRSRGWLPSKGASFGDGNRVLGGDAPHYESYLVPLFASVWNHPATIRDINSDEVLNARNECEAIGHIRADDQLRDCWDGGDGHIDRNNIYTADGDGDLSRIADTAYVHAVRAIAGLIYFFARETGQIPAVAPATLQPAGS